MKCERGHDNLTFGCRACMAVAERRPHMRKILTAEDPEKAGAEIRRSIDNKHNKKRYSDQQVEDRQEQHRRQVKRDAKRKAEGIIYHRCDNKEPGHDPAACDDCGCRHQHWGSNGFLCKCCGRAIDAYQNHIRKNL